MSLQRVGHNWATNIFTLLPRLKPDLAENSACLGNVHCSLSMSWLYSLHLSYKLSNMNSVEYVLRVFCVCQVIIFPGEKEAKGEANRTELHWYFGSRHTLHELELKLRGQEISDTGIGKFWGYHVYFFWPYLSSSATFSRRKFVLSEATVFVAVEGASCKESFRKAKFPGKDSWSLCKYLYNSGIPQGLWNCKDSHNCYIFLDSSSKYLSIY